MPVEEVKLMSQGPAQTTSLAEIRKANASLPPDTQASFFTVGDFDLMQRGARLLASSTLVPAAYRNEIEDKENGLVKNPNALSNCVLALNMAQRIQADPLMIMQNLYIVEGRPGWSSQFVIASINACSKFSPLRFTVEDKGAKEVEWTTVFWEGPRGQRRKREVQHKATIQDKECTAWAIEKATGERLEGPTVSLEMAVAEGWYGKNGSKWKTMPDVMLRYRAASFFGKLYAPELLMGLQTAEEVHDTTITLEPEDVIAASLNEARPANPSPAESPSPESPTNGAASPAPSSEQDEKQARAKDRAAQIAALAALRAEAKAAWEKTGAPLDEAETLVNAFQPKWNTAQCQRVLAEAQKREPPATPPASDPDSERAAPAGPPPGNLIQCPRHDNAPVDADDCLDCPERNGCPAR